MSYTLAAICSLTDGDVVLIASVMTVASVFSITLYACKTKKDLSK